MEYPIGVVLAALVCALAMLTGFDRGRVFYPTLLMVIATYYILFAVMGNSAQALTIESLVASSFLVVAVAGFKKNLWLVVAALAGHGVFDFIHHLFIQNPGVPVWWPGFCLAFDILAGGFLAVLLIRRSRSARTATETAGEYQARLDSYIGDKDPIAMQRQAPRTLAGLIEAAPDEVLSLRPAPGKWSVRAILAHLAEDELVGSWRYRQMIEHSGATLPGFDQDEWARLGDYDSWTAPEALEMFRLLREANLRMFGRLTPEEWRRCGTHAERGRITVEDLARHMAGHDVNHIAQVRRRLERI